MNRVFVFCLSLLCLTQLSWSQSDSVWRISLRAEALKSYGSQSRQLKSYYEAADIAVRSATKQAKKSLDSLMVDSIFLSAGIQLPLFADRLLEQHSVGNTNAVSSSLIAISMELDSLQEYNAFHELLLNYAIVIAEEMKNDKAAWLLNRCQLKVITSDHQVQVDSLGKQITKLERFQAEENASMESTQRIMADEIGLWKFISIALAAILVIALIVFAVVRSSILKKLRFELNKNLDTSELQLLVRKNEDLKSDCEQYKQTLEEVIQKMNALDQSSRNYAGIIEELLDMSLESLDFIRQQLEESKSKLSPEVYMALTNALSRSASSLRGEYHKTIDQLS